MSNDKCQMTKKKGVEAKSKRQKAKIEAKAKARSD